MQRNWQKTNDKHVKNFQVSVIETGEMFTVKASSQEMTLYDFKRLILSQRKQPFFLEDDVPNTRALKELYQANDVLRISFDIDNWERTVRFSDLKSKENRYYTGKFGKDKTVGEVLDEIRECMPQHDSIALVEDGAKKVEIKDMKEFSKSETVGNQRIHRYHNLQVVSCQITCWEVLAKQNKGKGKKADIKKEERQIWIPSLHVTGKEMYECWKEQVQHGA